MQVIIESEKKEEIDYILELVENSPDAMLISGVESQQKCRKGR